MRGIESPRKTLPRPQWFAPTAGAFQEASRLLFEEGVPANFIGRRFCLANEVRIIHTSSGAVLQFGTTGLGADVGVEADSGHVVELLLADPSSPRVFVNSSLSAFADTIEAIVGRFPFYDTDDDQRAIDIAADDLITIIAEIDPPAAEPDRYWSTFVDDVRMGDLTTPAVLDAVGLADGD